LQALLAPALVGLQGPGADAVARAYERARSLCQHVGDTLQLAPILLGLYRFYSTRAEHQTAGEVAEHLYRLTQHTPDAPQRALAHYALGVHTLWRGGWSAAQAHFAACWAQYETQSPQSPDAQAGHDPKVASCMYVAWTLWGLGYPEQAQHRDQDGVTLAARLAHPYSRAYALLYTAMLHQFLHEAPAGLQVRAEAAMEFCMAQGFETYLAHSMPLRGWALAAQGDSEEGIVQIHQGLTTLRGMGVELLRPYQLALLAEAYGQGSQPEAGLRTLAEALEIVERTGERFYEAELHRLTGELMLQHAVPDETRAETPFQQALAVARRQGAKSLELRAAKSLSRLWQQQGKRAEAYELLAPIYGWFTEGFDTADLQDAKVLLEALA
jgi:predicted ATPase